MTYGNLERKAVAMHEPAQFRAAVVGRSLSAAGLASASLLIARQWTTAEAVTAGTLVGLLSFVHILRGFRRLTEGSKSMLPLVQFEGGVRVVIAGAVPWLLFPHGPASAFFTYVAGFVAPIAVSAMWIIKTPTPPTAPAGADS